MLCKWITYLNNTIWFPTTVFIVYMILFYYFYRWFNYKPSQIRTATRKNFYTLYKWKGKLNSFFVVLEIGHLCCTKTTFYFAFLSHSFFKWLCFLSFHSVHTVLLMDTFTVFLPRIFQLVLRPCLTILPSTTPTNIPSFHLLKLLYYKIKSKKCSESLRSMSFVQVYVSWGLISENKKYICIVVQTKLTKASNEVLKRYTPF